MNVLLTWVAFDVGLEGDSDEPLSSGKILACSGAAKMVASITTYPHEVVRTRLQTQRRPLVPVNDGAHTHSIPPESSAVQNGNHKNAAIPEIRERGGVVYTVKRIIRREGWRGLYKGLSVNLFRTVPNSAVTMLTYVQLSNSSPSQHSCLTAEIFSIRYELLMRNLPQ